MEVDFSVPIGTHGFPSTRWSRGVLLSVRSVKSVQFCMVERVVVAGYSGCEGLWNHLLWFDWDQNRMSKNGRI